MSSYYTSLEELGSSALVERDKVEQVKSRIGVNHGYFDAWIYGFLENKNFDVEETVAKLERRFAMEVNELTTYELTDSKRQSMRSGAIQEIGKDKQGRTILYIKVKRDFPQAKLRAERQELFDIYISYATRIRQDSMRCQTILLVDQEGASMFKNIDMQASSEIALRISKYYPGSVEKIYVCNMSSVLTSIARPIIRRLPDIVSKRLEIITGRELKQGLLREFIDEDVLPESLGGRHQLREPASWGKFAERVETYFIELKRAAEERGMSVKEWELQRIGTAFLPDANPAATSLPTLLDLEGGHSRGSATTRSALRGSTHPGEESLRLSDYVKGRRGHTVKSSPTAEEEKRSVVTCTSDSFYLKNDNRGSAHDHFDYSAPSMVDREGGDGGGMSWHAVVAPLSPEIRLFFLEELLRWRSEIEDQERDVRFEILHGLHEAINRYRGDVPHSLDVSDSDWYTGILSPLRALLKLFLQGVVLINTVDFFCALIFLSLFTASLVTTLFLSFDDYPDHFFPLSCVLIMIIIQGVALCTRGCNMITAIYRNAVIPPFERLGSYWGTIAELYLFAAILLMQVVVFSIYSVTQSPFVSLQCAFTAGWMAAAGVLIITHIFFAFIRGTSSGSNARNSKRFISSLPFFLTFGIGKNVMKTLDLEFVTRTSSIVICGTPLALSFLFGIAFLISHLIELYVCTIVVTIISGFVVNYYTDAIITPLCRAFMRVVMLLLSTTWLFIVFNFGIDSIGGVHTATLFLALGINSSFFVLAFLCLRFSGNVWLLRVSFLIFVVYIIALWATTFFFIDARTGVFCLILAVHNLVNVTFAAQDLTNMSGALLLSTLILLLYLLCVLLGWYGTSVLYAEPHSLPPVPVGEVSNLALYHRYPVCALRLGPDPPLGVVDIALLTELAAARTAATRAVDLDRWFAGRGVVDDGVVRRFPAPRASWVLHRFALPARTTLLVLRTAHVRSAIAGLAVWLDAAATGPLLSLMPSDWARTLGKALGSARALGLPGGPTIRAWGGLLDALTDDFAVAKAAAGGPVLVSGAGVAGGFVSIAATRAGVQGVVFAAPGLRNLLGGLGLAPADYHRYVLAVGGEQAALDWVGGHDMTMRQSLDCEGSAFDCAMQPHIARLLLEACGDPYGRQHVPI